MKETGCGRVGSGSICQYVVETSISRDRFAFVVSRSVATHLADLVADQIKTCDFVECFGEDDAAALRSFVAYVDERLEK